MLEIVVPVLLIATPLALGVVFLLDRNRRGWRRAWERVAQAEGLTLAESSRGDPPAAAVMSGERDGRGCAIVVEVGRHQPVRARAGVELPGRSGFTLEMEREGIATWLETKVGGADLRTGDAMFDGRFRIETDDEQRAREVLDEATRSALLETELDQVSLTPDHVHVEVRASVLSDPDRLATRASLALRAAWTLALRLEGAEQAGAKSQPTSQPKREAPSRPALARAVRPALLVLVVLGGLGAQLLVRVWGESARIRQAQDAHHRLEVFGLAVEIEQLAFRRGLRAVAGGGFLTPEQEALFSDGASGQKLVELSRRFAAERASEEAQDAQRLATLRQQLRSRLDQHPDPDAFVREVEAEARRLAEGTAGATTVEQVLREALAR